MSTKTTHTDPVTAEVVRAAFVAITDEMKTNLMRTAYNVIIYEAQDFTVGLFDPAGDTLSIGLGLPMFVRGLSDAIKAKVDFYGLDGIKPGDILLTNDAYIMGSHLNHMIFTMPVFHDGEIVAFSSSMAHWLDVGGVLGGTTQDIYSEGLQMPIVKIYKEGELDTELARIIESNVRFSDLAMGDFRAQVAAIKTGERRLSELFARYGGDAIKASISDMYERSETLARQRVAEIEDGEYFAEAFMDDDGVNIGVTIPIKVRVVVEGDEMTIDLSGVSPQVAGYFNSGATAGRSAAQVAFKCLTSADVFPINDGSMRPLTVILPAGTVVSATKPAAMRWWMTYPMTIVDCILRALDDAVPDGAIAGHHADIGIWTANGIDQATGRFFLMPGGASGGGWGATADRDGEDATICMNDGDTHNTPVEALEAKLPMLTVNEYALREDSGGPGCFRGGLGTRTSFTIHSGGLFHSWVERTLCAPWGLHGGKDGAPNRVSVISKDESEPRLVGGKIDSCRVGAGDSWVIEMGGGGGYGDPVDRAADAVLNDVRHGYVSRGSAEEDYGVVLLHGPQGELLLDEEATHKLRERRRAQL